jgi:hypothetical protein
MTIDEYAREIAERIRRGYNSKDRAAAFSAIEDAEKELKSSKVSDTGRADFWKKTYQNFRSGQLLVEKQEGSALHQLMRDIERDLAEREARANGDT